MKKSYICQIQIDGAWVAMHPSDDPTPYQYETREEALRSVRMCYPDDYRIGQARVMHSCGFLPAGTPVWFRGAYASEFSLRGTIEEVIPTTDQRGTITGVHRYGVRLQNGNYSLCCENQVKELDPDAY